MRLRGPQGLGGTALFVVLYVPDCDAMINAAVAGGAKIIKPIQDQFYGDRSGTIVDPFGHKWTISTHKEDLSPEEIQKRAAAMHGQKATC